VVVECRYTGVYKPTGRALDIQVCHIWKLTGSRVVSFHQYIDTARLQAVMGWDLLAQPGAAECVRELSRHSRNKWSSRPCGFAARKRRPAEDPAPKDLRHDCADACYPQAPDQPAYPHGGRPRHADSGDDREPGCEA